MTRQLFLLITLFFSFQIAYTQSRLDNKSFKVDLGAGLSSLGSQGNGSLLYLEPSYTFRAKYKVGIRFEHEGSSMKTIESKSISFDYFLYNYRQLGLFAGSGISDFNVTESGGCGGAAPGIVTMRSTKRTGAFIRTGLEILHFRLSIEYNIVPSSYVTAVAVGGESLGTVVYKNNYISFKMGVMIGGGKKKRVKPVL